MSHGVSVTRASYRLGSESCWMILTAENSSTIVFISGFLMRLIFQHVCFESPLSWLSRLGV